MTPKKTLYLANPYGFSLQQRAGPLGGIVTDVLQLSKISKRAPGWVDQAPSHAALPPNSLLIN